MHRRHILLFVLVGVATVTAGCTSTASYRRPTSPDEAAKILAEPGNRQVELVVEFPQGSEVRRGTLAPFDAHRFVLTEPSGQRSSVLFQQTRSISYGAPGKGALVGALIGFIPGFLFGYAAGDSLASCGPFWDTCTGPSPFELGMTMGAITGLLTGGIGAAIGAATTYRNRTITF